MANMSYCRFQNTLLDLKDCVYTMEESYNFDDLELSSEETFAMAQMYKVCEDFIMHYDRMAHMSGENEVDEDRGW